MNANFLDHSAVVFFDVEWAPARPPFRRKGCSLRAAVNLIIDVPDNRRRRRTAD